MSKRLELLYREYTRSRMREMETADGLADVWRIANYRRNQEITQGIDEVLRFKSAAFEDIYRQGLTPLRRPDLVGPAAIDGV